MYLYIFPSKPFSLQRNITRKYSLSCGRRRGLHVLGALLAIRAVCRVLRKRKRNRRGSGDAIPAPESPNQLQPDSDKNVSLDDWRSIACQRGVLLGVEPDVRVSHRPGHNISIERSFVCSSKALMLFLFHPGSQFWDKWQTDRELLNLSIGAWLKHDRQGKLYLAVAFFSSTDTPLKIASTGIIRLIGVVDHPWFPDSAAVGQWHWTRTVQYVVPLKQFGGVGPSHAYTEEVHALMMVSPSHWEASITAKTPFVPMGNCFHITLSMSGEDNLQGGCMMRVTGLVNFHKPMRLRELVIRKPALSGMQRTYDALMDLISQQAVEHIPTSAYDVATIQAPLWSPSQDAKATPEMETKLVTIGSRSMSRLFGPMALLLVLWLAMQQHLACRMNDVPGLTEWLPMLQSVYTHMWGPGATG